MDGSTQATISAIAAIASQLIFLTPVIEVVMKYQGIKTKLPQLCT